MIDWAGLIFNALWVLGAAVILAALSFSHYEAQRRNERLRVRLAAPTFQMWLSVGLALISLGLALIGPRWWERVLWGLLCAMSTWQFWTAWQQWKLEHDRVSSPVLGPVERATPKTSVEAEVEGKPARLEPEPLVLEEQVQEPITWRAVVVPLALFIVVLLFYVITLAPTVLWGDAAYFQRTAFEGTLRADGGGHWLWLRVAQLFIGLPWGDMAYRVNLLSAVAAACAVVFVYAGGRALGLTPVAAMVAAVSLAVSHTFWAHAVCAEVYTLFMLLMALQLWLWFSWRSGRAWPILVAVLLFGLALLGHQMTVLLLPALGLLLWWRRRWLSTGQWLLLLLFFVVGMLPFFAVVKWQMAGEDLLTGIRLYFTHSGEDFRHALFDFSLGSLPRDAVMWVGLLGLQFVGLAGLSGLWGWIDMVRKGRSTLWLVLAVLYATGVLFAFSYHVNDQYVFYLPSYLVFAFFVGRGWQAVSTARSWASRQCAGALCVVLLIIVPIVVYDGAVRVLVAMDANPIDVRELPGREPNRFFLWPAKNGYSGAADYGRSVLETLPRDSILIADYTPMEPIRYFQSVEGLRPDVRTRYSGKNLARVIAQYPPESAIFFADDNPDYYDLKSLSGATLRQEGIVYRLSLEP
jgi:hypothetical protein